MNPQNLCTTVIGYDMESANPRPEMIVCNEPAVYLAKDRFGHFSKPRCVKCALVIDMKNKRRIAQ